MDWRLVSLNQKQDGLQLEGTGPINASPPWIGLISLLNMKVVLALLFCAVVVAARPGAPKGSYTTKYDNIDLEEILSNERLYKKYFDCLTNKGKCTPDGKELKGEYGSR